MSQPDTKPTPPTAEELIAAIRREAEADLLKEIGGEVFAFISIRGGVPKLVASVVWPGVQIDRAFPLADALSFVANCDHEPSEILALIKALRDALALFESKHAEILA